MTAQSYSACFVSFSSFIQNRRWLEYYFLLVTFLEFSFLTFLSYILIIFFFLFDPFLMVFSWHRRPPLIFFVFLCHLPFFFKFFRLFMCVRGCVLYWRGLVQEDLHKSRNCKDFFSSAWTNFFFFRKTNFQLTFFFLPLPWCALKSNSQPTSCSFAATLLLSIN